MTSIHQFRAEILVGDTFSRGFWKFSVCNAWMKDESGEIRCLSLMLARFFPNFVGLSYMVYHVKVRS